MIDGLVLILPRRYGGAQELPRTSLDGAREIRTVGGVPGWHCACRHQVRRGCYLRRLARARSHGCCAHAAVRADVTRAAIAGASVLAAVIAAAGLLAGQGSGAKDTAAPVYPEAAPRSLRVVTKQGHRTHPTWYHDSQILQLGGLITVAWNGDRQIAAAQLRADDLQILARTKVSEARLGGTTDSTGTDTDRHDVPAVLADAAGHPTFVYGGGSIAARGPHARGPYIRSATKPNAIEALTPERPLPVGGGSAFDFETVTDRTHTIHLIGQRGRGHTGALIELRLRADGTWLRPRVLIAGGMTAGGCVRDGQPRGCNRFAIARMTADPASGRLHLVWGWSEASLSGKCRTDAGYCDHDLQYAYSDDNAATWHNARGHATVVIAHRPLQADAPAFRVANGHVGLFKALALGPAGPLIVYTTFDGSAQSLKAARLLNGRWVSAHVASPTADVPAWNGSLVMRGGDAYSLWTSPGRAIHRFTSDDGISWKDDVVYRGPAWSLTGAPGDRPNEQLLLWRGKRADGHSWVMLATVPAR